MTVRDIALIDDLRKKPSENSIVEFKKDNIDPKVIGKLCSALSNSARIDKTEHAFVLWGIHDESHEVIGTDFNPDSHQIGNQVFQFWLAQQLNPSIAFSFREVEHPDGKVVILEIPAATSSPVEFNGTAYIRIGSATPKLSDYPDRFQKLINNLRPFTWEKGVAKFFLEKESILGLLDYSAYFRMTGQTLPDNHTGIFERLEADFLIVKDVGGRWNITNLGAILFAHDLEQFDTAISRKAIRFVAHEGKTKATQVTHRQDGRKGYAAGFEGLVNFINSLLPLNEHIGSAFRTEHRLYPEIAIRELIANALIHQDMTISGAGPQVCLFIDRLEITNPGQPLLTPDRMIDLPPRSRNEALSFSYA